jgi:phosphoglycolate phosphatase
MDEAECLLAASIWLKYKSDWGDCRRLAKEIIYEAEFSIPEDVLYQPLGGAKELLVKLEQLVPVAVATSDSHHHVREMFKYWQIDEPIVVTSEDVENGKPYPDMLMLASSLMGVSCNDILVFGDASSDVEMAHAAGAKAVAVGRSIEGADAWVKSLKCVKVEVLT